MREPPLRSPSCGKLKPERGDRRVGDAWGDPTGAGAGRPNAITAAAPREATVAIAVDAPLAACSVPCALVMLNQKTCYRLQAVSLSKLATEIMPRILEEGQEAGRDLCGKD